jgi:hypothetical protein
MICSRVKPMLSRSSPAAPGRPLQWASRSPIVTGWVIARIRELEAGEVLHHRVRPADGAVADRVRTTVLPTDLKTGAIWKTVSSSMVSGLPTL